MREFGRLGRLVRACLRDGIGKVGKHGVGPLLRALN